MSQNQSQQSDYPVQFHVEYPEKLSRVTTFLRIIMLIPIAIIFNLLVGHQIFPAPLMTHASSVKVVSHQTVVNRGTDTQHVEHATIVTRAEPAPITEAQRLQQQHRTSGIYRLYSLLLVLHSAGFLFVPTVLMILFCKKYPRWWFDWNLNLVRFLYRILAYFYLLTDEYPSTDQEQRIHLDIPYPDVDKLNRVLPLVKWVLVIPHLIVLLVLNFIALPILALSWICIILTGSYPSIFFDYIEAIMRWNVRVMAYSLILATDDYPPFGFRA